MGTNVTEAQLDVNVAFSIIITSVTIPSNFLLLLIFYRFKNLRDLNNTAITMLSCTDFVRGCLVMTFKIHNQLARVSDLGSFVCHLTALICAFSFVFSPLILALIALVRYCKIVPHSCRCWQLTDRIFYVISATLFVIASLFSVLPYIGVGDYAYSESHGVCFADWRDVNTAFRTVFYTLVIGIAFPVLTTSYTMLYLALRKHNKTFVSKHCGEESSNFKNGSFSNIDQVSTQVGTVSQCTHNEYLSCNPKENEDQGASSLKSSINLEASSQIKDRCTSPSTITEDKEEQQMDASSKTSKEDERVAVIFKIESPVEPTCPRFLRTPNLKASQYTKSENRPSFIKNISKQEYQITKLLILIFIAYVVCWFPAALVNVISLTHAHAIPEIWYYIIVSMVELKSALDPVIYGLGNRRYRHALKTMIGQLKKKFGGS